MKINGYAVPEPIRKIPNVGDVYWVVGLIDGYPYSWAWMGYIGETELLQKGLCHRTYNAAHKHREALLSFFEKKKV